MQGCAQPPPVAAPTAEPTTAVRPAPSATPKTPPLFGPYGSGALKYADRLAAHGANACWFHGFDARAFELCAQNKLAACVEFKTFRADFAQRPELIPIGVDGRPIRYGSLVQGVCLSKKEFLAETEAHLLDGLKQFRPAGIWLDYLTYGGWFETPDPDLQESCFCPECVAEFRQSTGCEGDHAARDSVQAPRALDGAQVPASRWLCGALRRADPPPSARLRHRRVYVPLDAGGI